MGYNKKYEVVMERKRSSGVARKVLVGALAAVVVAVAARFVQRRIQERW